MKSTSRLKKRKSQILRPGDLPHDLHESDGWELVNATWRDGSGWVPSDALYLSCASIPLAMALRTPTGQPILIDSPERRFCVMYYPHAFLCLWCCVFVVSLHPSSCKWCTDLERSILCCVFFPGGSEASVCVCVCVKLSSIFVSVSLLRGKQTTMPWSHRATANIREQFLFDMWNVIIVL